MNNSATRHRKSMSVFSQLADISALTSLSNVLNIITTEIKDLMEAAGSSVYLVPDVNPSFQEMLYRDGHEFPFDRDEHEHIIVLAATTREDMKPQIGKAFYKQGEGITGWVCKNKTLLNIKDTSDTRELKAIDPDLEWKDVYNGSKYYYKEPGKKPLLIIPLVFDDRQLGVIKFLGKAHHQPFTDWDQKLASLVARIVSSTVRHSAEIASQKNTILELIEIGSKHDKNEIFIELSKSMSELFRSEKSQIFMFNDDENSTLQLQFENGRVVKDGKVYTRGVGAIGWVYKTGKPLVINDLCLFNTITHLSNELLEKYSDSTSINETDREIVSTQREDTISQYPITFIAAPVKQDGEVMGVLAAQSKYGNSFRRSKAFSHAEDLKLANSFARIACNALEYEQEKLKADLLLGLAFAKDTERLFDLVIKNIPMLVSSSGCSIYEFKKGVQGPYCQLVKTSRRGFFQEDGKQINLTYKLGEDRTGLCGLSRCTIVSNHFGAGEVSEEVMDDEVRRISSRYPDDIVERLLDASGMQVGLIQIRFGNKCSPRVKEEFHRFSNTERVTSSGLPSPKIEHIAPNAQSAWSFAAIPIKDETDLFGIITISRPVPGNPFSSRDINTLEAVADKLGHFIGNIKLQEQRTELLMTLAHEVNTPLTGILADSENLKSESNSQSMKKLAENIIEQVMRLQLFTETIMGCVPGISEEKDGASIDFEYVNIGAILHDARNMFKAEAEFKGCDILEPKPIGDPQFPLIEMSPFHLGIAIKNIIHNAVKYSYRPVKGGTKNRFINIWGIWPSGTRQIYKINIQNYGVGISKEEIDKRLIFEPFYRGKKAGDRRRTGAGFGLAYARQVIEEVHHGKIDVTSVPSEDNPDGTPNEAHTTTFTICLPVVHNTSKIKG